MCAFEVFAFFFFPGGYGLLGANERPFCPVGSFK